MDPYKIDVRPFSRCRISLNKEQVILERRDVVAYVVEDGTGLGRAQTCLPLSTRERGMTHAHGLPF